MLEFASLFRGPEEDSMKRGVFVGNTLTCSCQVDTPVNLHTSWDTQLWDKGVISEGGRSLSMETTPGWCLKKADGVAPDGEAEKPSLFPNLQYVWGESSQTSPEAGRQPSEPQLVFLKFHLQTCSSYRRHTLCCGSSCGHCFPLRSRSRTEQWNGNRQSHHRLCEQLATLWAKTRFSEDTWAGFNFVFYSPPPYTFF